MAVPGSYSPPLRDALLGLTDLAFEAFLESALEEFTGLRFFPADSGTQQGGDGTAEGPFRIVYEAKRYDRANIPLDGLMGKFVMATQRVPRPDLWILAGTRNVSDQRQRTLQREADEKGVSLLILDMPRGRLGPLATLCACTSLAAARFLPDAGPALAEVRVDPAFEAARRRLQASLDPAAVGFVAVQTGMRRWLDAALNSPDQSRTRLQLRLPTVASSDAWAGYVPRSAIRTGFTAWSSKGGGVFCIAGEEGVGKSLGAFDLLRDRFEDQLVIVIGRSAEVVADPLELMARAVAQALGGEGAPWRRKLEFLLERECDAPLILLYLDGVDERPGEPWQALLENLEDERFRAKVAVLMSVRPSPLEGRLRSLGFLGVPPVVRPLDIFTEGELDLALAKRQLSRATFAPEMQDLMRRPRLFDLALQHRDRLEAAGEFTAARLYWEDWEDRVARGRGIASAGGFRAALSQMAKDLDAKLVLAPSALIGAFQVASPFDPQSEPVRQSISELVDGGLARLDGQQVKIEPRFAALALGYDLERRLDAAFASGTAAEAEADLADQVRIWLEPWGGADFDAEVVRAAAWARHLVAQGGDVVMQALLAVWLDRKILPPHHGDDIVALTRASPQLVLPGFQDLLSGPDVAAASRAGAILAARAGVPALRPVLIAEARRWVCEIGLMDYPFLGANPDPADYRTKRLSAVQDLLQAELAFDTPLLVEGETVTFHDAEMPDGARICKKALGLLRPGGANDLWPILRAWAVTTSLRYHDDLGESVAGVLRSVEAGSPLDVMARTQLEAWAASRDPVAVAAARSLSWALGDPEARRVAEPALVASGFVAQRTEELEQSRGRFSPETVAEVRAQVARHKGPNILRRCEHWTYDPEFELPAKVIEDAVARVAKFDPDGLLIAQATTETSLDVEAVTPVLARTDPKRLGDWMRRFASAAATSELSGGDIYRRHVIRDLVVLGRPELEAIAGTQTPGRAADDLRLRAELARRDGDAQIEFLLGANLSPQLTVQLVNESRAPGAAGMARVVSALQGGIRDDDRLGLLLFHLASTLTEVPEALAEQLLALVDHSSTVVRTYVFQLLSLAHAGAAAMRLQAMGWNVADAGSDQEAWWGSKLLCAGGAPLSYVQSAANPRHVLDACRGSGEGGLRRFAALLDDKVRRISGSTLAPDPAKDIAALAAAVEAHEDKLSSGRRADWRLAPRTLAQVWKADPRLFDRLGARMAGLDDIQLGDAVHASPGLVLAVMEAGLDADPARMATVWRRLPGVIAREVVYRAEFSTDWARTMPFAVASAPWGLLDEALELARTDAALMNVTMLAEHEGHGAWLEDAIARDVASPTAWRQARGLMLQGLSGRVPAGLDPYPRLDARASWLASVMATAEGHRRRRFRLDHWFDRFDSATTPDEVFASFELVKGAATRWVHVRLAQGDRADLQLRHVARQESELKREIEKAEKKMADTFLGSKAVPGIWPPP